MSTFSTDNLLLPDLMDSINKGKIQLPEFQRDWIWDDIHIRDLLVSIAKSFPIGSIMLLRTGNKTKFKPRPVEGTNVNEIIEKPEMLIMDGQQRLTSLIQALTSKGPVITKSEKKRITGKFYYIDINLVLENHNLDDAIVAVDSGREKVRVFGHDELLDLTTVENECKELLFPCNQILNANEWESSLLKYFPDNFKKYADFRHEIVEKIRRYKIPAIILENDTEKEAVCLVFEKVNSRGVQLTVFELVTASFAADGFSLREKWYGDAKNNVGIKKRFSEKPTLIKVEPTEFLQAIFLLTSLEQRRKARKIKSSRIKTAITAKRSSLLTLTPQNYKDYSKDVESGFHEVANFLKSQCMYTNRDLPYKTQLIPIAAVFAKLGIKWRERKYRNKIEQLYWSGVLGELYGGTTDTQIANDFEDLMIWFDNNEKKPRTLGAVFDVSRFLTLKNRNSAAFKGLYSLILKNNALDFWCADSIQSLDFDEIKIDMHHIFPKKWCNDNFGSIENIYDYCDSIINKTPISSKANKIIGGDPPSVYLDRIQEKAEISNSIMDRILKSHGIDPISLRNDDFERFVEKREQFLIKLIRKEGVTVSRNI